MANNTLTSDQKLQKLVSFRSVNIQNILNEWTDEDFEDMRKVYINVKELALENKNIFSVKLNEEKLSQLEEARSLKQKVVIICKSAVSGIFL